MYFLTTTRNDLEKQAQAAICSCHHYNLMDNMDEMTDIELEKIIADGQYVHKQQYYDGMITKEEYNSEINGCNLTKWEV